MTTTNIKALWLEENDVVYINENSYRVVEVVINSASTDWDSLVSSVPPLNDLVDVHLIDEEGFRRILTILSDNEVPVICDASHDYSS